MRPTLVTGAAGFTGRYLARLLADQGHEVHGVVHQNVGTTVPGVHMLHEADLADSPAIARIIKDVRPELIVHLAAIAFVAHGDLTEMYRTNIMGTRQLLEAAATSHIPPRAVLLASSASVYGTARHGMLTEDLPPEPANDYGVSKAAMEQVAAIYAKRLPIIVVRPFNYTGRGQSENFLVPKIVKHVRERASIIKLGNLDIARDFSDVRTVTDTYAKLLLCPGAIGGTFNICSGHAVTLGEIVAMVRRISGHEFTVVTNPNFVRTNEVPILTGSATKLMKLLGSGSSYSLEQTLRWMLGKSSD